MEITGSGYQQYAAISARGPDGQKSGVSDGQKSGLPDGQRSGVQGPGGQQALPGSYVAGRAESVKDTVDIRGKPKEGSPADKGKPQGKGKGEDKKVDAEVQKLKQREQQVITHEQAHMSVGGQYAGAVNYEYTQGPDGKRYISGGEVSIDVSEEKDPEATIRKMEQVRASALAPADPSSQDQSVAAAASQKESQARMEVAKKTYEQISGKGNENGQSAGMGQSAGIGQGAGMGQGAGAASRQGSGAGEISGNGQGQVKGQGFGQGEKGAGANNANTANNANNIIKTISTYA